MTKKTPKEVSKAVPKPKKVKEKNTATLLIGRKPTMSYVLYTINQLTNVDEITVKARGKSINKAVDTVEILRRRFLPNLKIKNIEIGTVEVEDKERNLMRRISTMEISFKK